jgi:hypothetical protein
MSMERIEERCLAYLSQASNPLVPFRTLLEYARSGDESLQIGEQELLAFLKYHELMHVLEPFDAGGEWACATVEMDTDRHVILKSRIPNRKEMVTNLRGQLDGVRATLQAALDEARSTGDFARVTSLEQALERAEELDGRFGQLR